MKFLDYLFWQLVNAARSNPAYVEQVMVEEWLNITGQPRVCCVDSVTCRACGNQTLPVWFRDNNGKVCKICSLCNLPPGI